MSTDLLLLTGIIHVLLPLSLVVKNHTSVHVCGTHMTGTLKSLIGCRQRLQTNMLLSAADVFKKVPDY